MVSGRTASVSRSCSILHAVFLCSCRQAFSLYSSIDTTTAWKKLRFILSVRSDFHMTDSLSIPVYAFACSVLMSVSVDVTYFYSSTATIVCSRNTVSESSHISFFCGGNPFCKVVWQPENTHGKLTGLLEWQSGLCLQSKIADFTLSFQVPCGNMNILFAHLFFC